MLDVPESLKGHAEGYHAFVRGHLDDRHVLPIEDEPEHNFEDESDDFDCAPIVFDMSYSGGSQATMRRVKLLTVKHRSDDILIGAYCFMRGAYRSFRLTSINHIVDITTGEVFDQPRAFFEECGVLEQLSAEASALMDCANDLTVLAFLGSCDGRFLPSEQDAVLRHVCYCVDTPLDEEFLRRKIAALAPDAAAFRRALKRLRLNDERRRRLIRAVREVIDADGVVELAEQTVGAAILKSLHSD